MKTEMKFFISKKTDGTAKEEGRASIKVFGG
jgi:hypothetical protein